jgi:PAS domain S-box-containing protein
MQHLEMLQTKGYYGPYEKEYVRKDGSRIPLRLNGVLITGPDGDQYIWSIVEDISAAKKTEALLFESDERFSHLVNSIPQMVWTASVDGNLVFANQKLLQFLGTPTNDPAVVQRALFEALSPAGSSALADAWNRHVQTTPAELNVELQAMRYDGEYRWLDLHAVPIQNQDGQLTHWIGTLTDVSERRLADLNLRESQKLEAIGSLTGGLAHDFNNLLGIVLGNLDMLTAAHLEPKAAAQVQVALAAAERGAELTKSLLALAQGQSATPTPTSLNALLKRMEPLLVHTAGVRVKLALNFELKEAIAWVDSAALESSLLNLVLNARDAMPQGGELSIILRTPSKLEAFELLHGPYATLEVVDTGCGMTPEVTRKATHPFFTTKERGRGTGLGLAMVEGFAHQAAGRLRIHSKVGEGTSVQLTLPLTGMPIPENSPRMADAVLPASNLARVLIVDDEELLLDILSIWLTDAGYAVRVCTSGDQAWVALQTDMPDFLITDVVMPGTIDGLELARRARLLAPHLRILVVSGFPSQGAGDVAPRPWPMLSKPCRRDDLLKMLQQM